MCRAQYGLIEAFAGLRSSHRCELLVDRSLMSDQILSRGRQRPPTMLHQELVIVLRRR